jgi:hypothetical protein
VKLQKHLRYVIISIVSSLLLLLSLENVLAEGQSTFSQGFFRGVEPIMMEDKLAANLGAVDKGSVFIYNYEDAVKLAGHSCLAVSGAYRLTQIALKRLYGEETPVRGEIEVTFGGDVEYKINGPISQVVTLITGAAGENGFKGFGGKKFRRYNLLRFDKNSPPPAGVVCSVILKRVDTGRSINITYAKNMLPSLPDMQEMVKIVLLGEMKNMFVITEQ